MKRIVQALMWMTVLLGPVYAQSATAPFVGFCVNGGISATTSGQSSTNKLQGVIPLCTVTVYLTGTTTQATLYKDSSNTTLTNPFQANADGSWLFFAGTTTGFFNQGYDVVLSGGYAPNAYTTPRTLTGQYEVGANSLDSMVNLLTSMVPITTAGCVPNSTAPAVMTANVACLNSLLNVPGRYYAGPGVWNVNACVVASNQGGFVLEGAGPYATSIIQNTPGVCIFKPTGVYPNEWRIADMTLGHSVRQSPVTEGVTAPGAAIEISPTYNSLGFESAFDFYIEHIICVNSARCIDFDKTANATIWAYDYNDILCMPSVTGACVNMTGADAGNPRPHLHKIYSESLITTEPQISTSTTGEMGVDDIEATPSTVPVSIPITAYSTSGSTVTLTATNSFVSGQFVYIRASAGPTYLENKSYQVLASGLSGSQFQVTQSGATGSGAATGTVLLSPYPAPFDFQGSSSGSVNNLHIENFTIGDINRLGNQGMIHAENGSLTFTNLHASLWLCPAPFFCNGNQPTVWFVSNNAGGGNLTLHTVDMQAYPTVSAVNSNLYGMRFGTNQLTNPSCDGWSNSFTAAANILHSACVYTGSDTAQMIRNGQVVVAPASNLKSSSWAITSVADSVGASATYTGTFTGCNTSLFSLLVTPNTTQGHVWVTGFVATPANNGYFLITGCTATTLTVKNNAAVAETQAATAVSGINSVGMNYYARMWDTGGSVSTTQNCAPTLQPTYNPVTGYWDDDILTMCSQPPTGSQIYTQIAGQMRIYTQPASGYADLNPSNSYGLSGAIISTSPEATFGSIPALRFYKNAGGAFFSGDVRVAQGGVTELCPSTSYTALQSETPQTDLLCSFMTDALGSWYNTHGTVGGAAVAIVPYWVTGHHGGSAGVAIPLATNWANTTGAVTCDDGGGNLTITGCVGLALSVTFTTTVASPENVTLTGATTGTHCAFGAKNATAATNIATAYIVSETANTVSFAHAATAGMVYEFVCR